LLSYIQFKKSKYYLDNDIEITIDTHLNLSSYLIDWDNSKLPKEFFIKKYNAAIRTKQFITDESGNLVATDPEGYVAVDHIGNAVKLVNRLEFSRANFAVSKGEKFK
jgi:hypothetical protein